MWVHVYNMLKCKCHYAYTYAYIITKILNLHSRFGVVGTQRDLVYSNPLVQNSGFSRSLSQHVVLIIKSFYTILNQVRQPVTDPHAWFPKIALVCASVHVCVCLPPRALITSGVIWCDIDRV